MNNKRIFTTAVCVAMFTIWSNIIIPFGNVDVVAVTVRHIVCLLLSVVENQLVISSVVV